MTFIVLGAVASVVALAGGGAVALSKELRESRQGRDILIGSAAAAIVAAVLLLKGLGYS